tara:strand:- start:182 stop:1855 length:1674 start_codon:yes stop_codon:yes gene_type:complete
MLISIPFAWFWMAPHQLKDFSQSLLATSLFSSNIFFFLETDYFNDFSETAPLLHTWSLAVEEQFYLFFPLIIIFFWRFGISFISFILIIIFLSSLIFSIWASVYQPSFNFYLLPSRAWELLVGVFISLYLQSRFNNLDKFRKIYSEILGLAGIFMILVSIIIFDKNTPFPSLYTLLPVLGTALVILFTTQKTVLGKFLSGKYIVGIGLMSYSLYLWHQPIFAFARIRSIDEISSIFYIALILLSFMVAKLSLDYVEAPFRNKKNFSPKAILALSISLIIFFVIVGYKGHKNDGYLAYKISQVEDEFKGFVIDKNKKYQEREKVFNKFLKSKESSSAFNEPSDLNKVLILGDSKSEDLYVSIMLNKELFPKSQFRRMRLDNRCMTSLQKFKNTDKFSMVCAEEIESLLSSDLLKHADTIFISNTWELFNNSSVKDFIKSLNKNNKRVLIMGTGNFNDVASLSLLISKNKINAKDQGRFFYKNIRKDWRKSSMDLKTLTSIFEGVVYIDKLEAFCNFASQECKLYSDNNEPYIFDSGHLTVDGSMYFGQKVSELNWLDR